MEDNKNGERKKLSLSLGGKLTLKTSVTSKASSSISTNTRSARGTVQVEVKRAKRVSNRSNVGDTTQLKNTTDNNTGLTPQEIQSRSRMLQEGLAKTAAQAELLAAEKFEKAKLEEARIAATADEASKAASSLAPKDKILARRKAETKEILRLCAENNLTEEYERFVQISFDSRKWEKWLKPNSSLKDEDKATISGHYIFSTNEFIELKQKISFKLKKYKIDFDLMLYNSVYRSVYDSLLGLNWFKNV